MAGFTDIADKRVEIELIKVSETEEELSRELKTNRGHKICELNMPERDIKRDVLRGI